MVFGKRPRSSGRSGRSGTRETRGVLQLSSPRDWRERSENWRRVRSRVEVVLEVWMGVGRVLRGWGPEGRVLGYEDQHGEGESFLKRAGKLAAKCQSCHTWLC